MSGAVWSPGIVPYGADQTAYLVIDHCGGGIGCETEVERTDIETIIVELMSGQYGDPIRVVAFNTLEHWSDDISAGIATELQTRYDIQGDSIPEYLHDFVATNAAPTGLAAGPVRHRGERDGYYPGFRPRVET